ncbi:TonB-dependent receptor [Sphingomonas sp.]|uniref:TonB-dependent receptor n=1 Tax=Sphingomonas sp. TaxID=28214 RepID=UPI0025D17205|nr:TonB-dependent receptor [Sphingomonas sp.]
MAAYIIPNVAQAAPAAQSPTATNVTDAPVDDGPISDIIVTARRVNERLQDIPASVAAVSSEQVARMASLADIQSMVSGVTFKSYGPIPIVGIRGFGNRSQAGIATTSTVGIFQDGVFVSPPLVSLISRVDTGRIEVAKGPQSTLYGRASYTGAINIVSNDPGKDFSGYVEAGYGRSAVGNENLWSARGAVSIPLSDTLSVRFFGLREKRDGFTYDSVTGNRGAGYDRTVGRVRLLWQPSDLVTARLTGTIMRDDIPLGLVHTGRTRAPLSDNVIFGNLTNPAVNASLTFGNTVWDASYVRPQSGKTRGEQVTLDLRFQTPMGELASLTDFQHSSQKILTSIDLTRLGIVQGNTPFAENRWSQELRLANKTGRLSYLFGLYFLHVAAEQGGGKAVDLSTPFASFGPGAALFDQGLNPAVPVTRVNALYQPVYTETNAYAAFGQVGYDITDALNLTVGLRYSRDELRGTAGSYFRSVILGTLLPSATPIKFRNAEFSAITGSANLSYKISPDVIVYGSYSRGNSPGGLNGGAASLINYNPQKVDAYEVGLKSKLLDRRLQLNIALFDNEYKDIQITQNTFINRALTGFITNAGQARGRGFDMDAIAVLSSSFRLGLQYTYADSKITKFNILPAPALQVDFTGVPLVRSPHHSLNASATFTQDIGPGKLQLTAEESYTSSYTNDYQGAPAGFTYTNRAGVASVTASQVLALYRTPGYAISNVNGSYTVNKWQINAYVRNLFNKQYIAAVLGFDATSYPQEVPGEPRTYGLTVKYSF